MSDHTIDIPGLLGARICHDLISPVGAIGNGVELLTLSGELDGPERDLIAESAASANARLQMFRLAFGRAGYGQMHSAMELRTMLTGYLKDYDLVVDWFADKVVSRSLAKTLLLAMMCLETTIGRAGRITVQASETGWHITALAARGTQVEPLLRLLASNGNWPADLTPAQVQFPLARQALKNEGMQALVQIDGAQLSLTLSNSEPEAPVSREPSRRLLQDT